LRVVDWNGLFFFAVCEAVNGRIDGCE
jgi:hypothetical protein